MKQTTRDPDMKQTTRDPGPFIRFAKSGRRYFFKNPDAEPPLYSDLLYGLAGIIRGTGQFSHNYDVLRHSWVCYQYAWGETKNDEFSIACANHDLEEAVTGDFATPLKDVMPELRTFGTFHRQYLHKLFGVPTLSAQNYATMKMIDKLVGDVEGELWVKDWVPFPIADQRGQQERSRVRELIARSLEMTDESLISQLTYELNRYRAGLNLPPIS